ncbi:MAG: hypothetical protein JWP57_277 [Spirosoma sp.]|nr:hypothetical protein [Spirosoma sp.]
MCFSASALLTGCKPKETQPDFPLTTAYYEFRVTRIVDANQGTSVEVGLDTLSYRDEDGVLKVLTNLYNENGPKGQSTYIKYIPVTSRNNHVLEAYASTSTTKGHNLVIEAGLIRRATQTRLQISEQRANTNWQFPLSQLVVQSRLKEPVSREDALEANR